MAPSNERGLKLCFLPPLQGDGGMDGRASDIMDGGRMALDNKTSLLNTTLLSSSPRGAREHFLDSPYKHRSKDTSMDDSDQLSDGTRPKGHGTHAHHHPHCHHHNVTTHLCFGFVLLQTEVWTSRSWWPSC